MISLTKLTKKRRFKPGTDEVADFSSYLFKSIIRSAKKKNGILFVCIGSTLIIGDSLGPKIGQNIKSIHSNFIKVFGTLNNPVHAINLSNYSDMIRVQYSDWIIIAIDAALGNYNDNNCIIVKHEPLAPGLGVGKELNEIGDISILGIIGQDRNDLYAADNNDIQNLVDFISNGLLTVGDYLANGT